MTFPEPLDSPNALVTGASSGIGSDIARSLAKRKYGVILVARRKDRLNALAKELKDAYGVDAVCFACDLSDADARLKLKSDIEDKGLIVDILINNAGFSSTGPVHRGNRDKELLMIRTNIEAVADLCSLFTPQMATRRRGAVLNVASTAAFQPLPGQAGYAASKSFVLSYSHALRAELEPIGVSVTALCPGPVLTEFGETAGLAHEDSVKALPKFMWVSSPEVAETAVLGLLSQKSVVIPGAANRVGSFAAYIAPRKFITKLLAKRHPAMRV